MVIIRARRRSLESGGIAVWWLLVEEEVVVVGGGGGGGDSFSTRAAREVVGCGFVVLRPMPTTALNVLEQ